MFVSLRMFTLPAEQASESGAIVRELRNGAARLPGVLSNWIEPVYPTATINAGHIIWRMCHKSESDAQTAMLHAAWNETIAPLTEGLELSGVGYNLARFGGCSTGSGIWRALLFSCFPDSDPAQVKELEDKTLLLPKYVPEIRSLALNKAAWSEGPRPIEFVWEQEYDSVDGLTGPYMNTPMHWGLVDAYFDADCPEYIVDPHLIQVVGAIDQTIMNNGQ